MRCPTTLAERESLDRQLLAQLGPGWDYTPGDNISAGLLCRAPYVVSIQYTPIWKDLNDPSWEDTDAWMPDVVPRLTCVCNPTAFTPALPGEYRHVGCYESIDALLTGIQNHEQSTRAR